MKGKGIFIALGVLLLLSACREKERRYEMDGFAQGTTYHIVYRSGAEEPVAQRSIDSVLAEFDNSCSIYNPASLLSRINRNETDSVDRYIAGCIAVAQRINRESGELYDITVKPLVSAYGFGAEGARERVNVDSLLQFVGMDKIAVSDGRLVKGDPRVEIDLNSIAQGYAVDLLAGYIRSRGVTDFLVELGGEIYASGTNGGRAWRIGIDRPVDGNFTPGADLQVILEVGDRGLNTSGNYRKFHTDASGRRINHTLNPMTGESVQNSLLSATVIAPDATLADGYATMLMAIGLEAGQAFLAQRDDLEGYLIYTGENGEPEVWMTPGMEKRIVK